MSGIKWAGIALLLLLVGGFFLGGCERIDAGHVGLKVNMSGDEKGVSKTEYVTGWVFYNSFSSKVYEFPTFVQHKEYEAYDVPTKGGTVFSVHPTFNYQLEAGHVAEMFTTYRLPLSQLEDGYLKSAVQVTIREVTNTFTVDSLLYNLAVYDAAVLTALNKKLYPFFSVSQFTSNLVPDPKLKDAIADKAKKVQEAQAKLAEVAFAEANARVEITNAKKDSSVVVTRAKGDAEAIRVKQQALNQSPAYIELRRIEAWEKGGSHVPTTVLGGNTDFLFSANK